LAINHDFGLKIRTKRTKHSCLALNLQNTHRILLTGNCFLDKRTCVRRLKIKSLQNDLQSR
ncbi:hypothetical protein RvY_10351, partial [Ramazzottius varieornatus]